MKGFVAALGLVLAVGAAVGVAPAHATTFTSKGSSLGKWGWLTPTQQLVSPNGKYRATLQQDGRLAIRLGTRVVWFTRETGIHAKLLVHADGNVTINAGSRLLWASATWGAGPDARFAMRDTGALAVSRPAGYAWSSRYGNRCRAYTSGRKVFVDLSEQYLWLCGGGQQQLIARVTTGAVDLGNGTPTGQWHVQGHQRDRYLYPAAGGAYFVHYWMPYDYDYGFHDSSWQHFAYGSERYRTEGSHGCVHVPPGAMPFVYAWAQTGTLVTIRS